MRLRRAWLSGEIMAVSAIFRRDDRWDLVGGCLGWPMITWRRSCGRLQMLIEMASKVSSVMEEGSNRGVDEISILLEMAVKWRHDSDEVNLRPGLF